MSDFSRKDELLTAAECAARIGLTVRALRVYERHGLLAPRRTEKGWRLYGAVEIARLHEILALKQLGLSLARIAQLLEDRANDLDRALAMQETSLLAMKRATERGLALVAVARNRLAAGEALSVTELVNLAKETQMTEPLFDAIAQRRYEQARPRKAVPIDPALLGRYVGHYKSDFGVVWDVTRREDKLFFKNPGWPVATEALPESDHQFFFSRWPTQVSFHLPPDGPVDRFTLHHGGFESLAYRIDAAEAEKEAAILASRIKNKTPNPGSEQILRRTIASLQSGDVDFGQFIESLSSHLKWALPAILEEFSVKGALREIAFRGVGKMGGDVYDVKFDNENTEWRIGLAPDGKIRFLFWRSMP